MELIGSKPCFHLPVLYSVSEKVADLAVFSGHPSAKNPGGRIIQGVWNSMYCTYSRGLSDEHRKYLFVLSEPTITAKCNYSRLRKRSALEKMSSKHIQRRRESHKS
jgi:hypothetical protein